VYTTVAYAATIAAIRLPRSVKGYRVLRKYAIPAMERAERAALDEEIQD
jgi:hypothetical protein